MNDHKQNKVTWQAYILMLTNLESLKANEYPNGQTLTTLDIPKLQNENKACMDILNEHNCAVPVIKNKPGDQLTIF